MNTMRRNICIALILASAPVLADCHIEEAVAGDTTIGGAITAVSNNGARLSGITELDFQGSASRDPAKSSRALIAGGGGGGGGYATIQEEGAGLTQRTIFNFIGAALTAADNTTRTNITLSQSPAASTSVVGTGRTITCGNGLTGGGDLSADRTCDVVANADGSIVSNANDLQVGVLATDAQHGNRGGGALHANANGSTAGFIAASDFTKLGTYPNTGAGLQGEVLRIDTSGNRVFGKIFSSRRWWEGHEEWSTSTCSTTVPSPAGFLCFPSGGSYTASSTLIGPDNPFSGQFSTGATATGRIAAAMTALNGFWFDLTRDAEFAFDVLVQFEDLSTAGEHYSAHFGASDSGNAAGDPTDGVYYRYSHDDNTGEWQLCAKSGASVTCRDCDIAVAADTSYRLEMAINTGSLTGTINGTSCGAPITTDIPDASGEVTSLVCAKIEKEAGTTPRVMYVDYCSWRKRVSR